MHPNTIDNNFLPTERIHGTKDPEFRHGRTLRPVCPASPQSAIVAPFAVRVENCSGLVPRCCRFRRCSP